MGLAYNNLIENAIEEYVWKLINECIEEENRFVDTRRLSIDSDPEFMTSEGILVKPYFITEPYMIKNDITTDEFKQYIKERIRKKNANIIILDLVTLWSDGFWMKMYIGRIEDLNKYEEDEYYLLIRPENKEEKE